MSGGSMDYLSYKIDDVEIRPDTALRRAFAEKLPLFARALHEIEWADSGDTAVDNENERAAIEAVLGEHAELDQLIKEATRARDALNEALGEVR